MGSNPVGVTKKISEYIRDFLFVPHGHNLIYCLAQPNLVEISYSSATRFFLYDDLFPAHNLLCEIFSVV